MDLSVRTENHTQLNVNGFRILLYIFIFLQLRHTAEFYSYDSFEFFLFS